MSTELGWQRLSTRSLLPQLRGFVGALIPLAIVLLVERGTPGRDDWIRAGIASGIFVLIGLAELSTVLTTRFRVTETALELRQGLLIRRRTRISRDRVRRFDSSADPIQRLLGIATVRVAAAGGDTIALRGVTAATVAELRDRIRARTPGTDADDDQLLAGYRPGWIRYAPLSAWGVGGLGILAGVVYQAAQFLGLPVEGVWRFAGELLGSTPLWQAVILAGALVLALGTVLTLVAYPLEWRGYQLRDDGDTVSLTRGALTTKQLSLRRDRLIGVELVQTLLTAPARAGHIEAIATGMSGAEGDDDAAGADLKVLTPVIEDATAAVIAARLLGIERIADDRLVPRPTAARARRLLEALRAAVLLGLLGALPLLFWPGAVTTLLAGVVGLVAISFFPLAWWEHRRMGHLLTEGQLISRSGVYAIRTSIIQRDRIIGFASRQSWFQRRKGLLTLTAVIPGGKRTGITLVDLDEDTAAQLVASCRERWAHQATTSSRRRRSVPRC